MNAGSKDPNEELLVRRSEDEQIEDPRPNQLSNDIVQNMFLSPNQRDSREILVSDSEEASDNRR